MKRSRWSGYQSILAGDIEAYVTAKRALGRRFDQEESGLRLLDRFLVQQRIRGRHQITSALLERFLLSRPRRSPRSYNELLGHIRRLLKWLMIHRELRSLPRLPRPRRRTGTRFPFIFDRVSAKRLLEQAAALEDSDNARNRGPTYRVIFALLYGLGLRVSELCQLEYRDIDFDRHLLCIRRGKFGKKRLVPFGPRVAAALAEHVQRNDHQFGTPLPESPVFSFDGRKPINRHSINRVFRDLVCVLDLPRPPGVGFPRTHDLRHSCAVGALLRWYRSGIDPSTRLLHLSTFLGHVDVSSTAVYLTMTPELLREANLRFERFTKQAVGSCP